MKPVLIAWWMFIAGWVTAQIPQGIKYQAVARNESGDILANQQISIRVSILDSAAGGQSVYSEIHKEGTNAYGLFSIEIGRGLSPMGDFTAISWATGKKWLKVELDPAGGSNYALMGISELLSVPYAFFAGSALNASGAVEDSTDELQTLSISGDTLFISKGNFIQLPTSDDNQQLTLTGTLLSIENGNTVDLGPLQDGVNDADSDPTNELQQLSLLGDTLLISGGNSVILSTSGTDSDWIIAGNDMYNGNTGHIGIGTPAPHPSAILDISSTNAGLLIPRMTSSQRLAISNPATGLEVFDITAGVKMYYNGQRWLEVGAVPIGTIQAFHKSMTGTPSLPWGWVECNGQVLNDPESPYDGLTLPALNATFTTEAGSLSSAGLFLRGSSVSGIISADQTNTLKDFDYETSFQSCCSTYPLPLDGTYSPAIRYDGNPNQDHGLRMRNRGVETYPGNMTVVWIMRVK